jgi:REP element-mobilizing transposase RayT
LKGVKKYLAPVATIIVYCLMPTHYHILVRVKHQTSEVFKTSEVSKQVSLAMQKFLISYTKAINKRFQRVGSLFQGQFQAEPIRNYAHLLNLCVYIHANPVKDGLVAAPEDWIYSNYLEWLGQREGTLVDREFIQENFGSPAEYQTLVMEYIKTRYLPDDVRKYLQSLED